MPIIANKWMRYSFWVDWYDPKWNDWNDRTDVASRPFEKLDEAKSFVQLLENSGCQVMLAERGKTNEGSGQDGKSLFYFKQTRAAEFFTKAQRDEINKLDRGFGIEWRDGEETAQRVQYTPMKDS